jgi:phosphatidylglycerophosphatase A
VALYVGIAEFSPARLQTILIALALLVSCAVTVALAPWAERHWAKKDSGNFVTDEVAGFLLTVLLFRASSVLLTVLWAFPVTRILDILKVPPAKQLERLPAGWGVVADDLMASLYAAIVLHVAACLFPQLFGFPT